MIKTFAKIFFLTLVTGSYVPPKSYTEKYQILSIDFGRLLVNSKLLHEESRGFLNTGLALFRREYTSNQNDINGLIPIRTPGNHFADVSISQVAILIGTIFKCKDLTPKLRLNLLRETIAKLGLDGMKYLLDLMNIKGSKIYPKMAVFIGSLTAFAYSIVTSENDFDLYDTALAETLGIAKDQLYSESVTPLRQFVINLESRMQVLTDDISSSSFPFYSDCTEMAVINLVSALLDAGYLPQSILLPILQNYPRLRPKFQSNHEDFRELLNSVPGVEYNIATVSIDGKTFAAFGHLQPLLNINRPVVFKKFDSAPEICEQRELLLTDSEGKSTIKSIVCTAIDKVSVIVYTDFSLKEVNTSDSNIFQLVQSLIFIRKEEFSVFLENMPNGLTKLSISEKHAYVQAELTLELQDLRIIAADIVDDIKKSIQPVKIDKGVNDPRSKK